MNDLVYRQIQTDIRAADDKARIVRNVTISDETQDAHESVIRAGGWKLDRYRSNPVLIWAHTSRGEPSDILGTADVVIEGNRLAADLRFVPEGTTTKADEVWRLVEAGVLRGVSVGFRTLSYHWDKPSDAEERLIIDEAELVELSIVPVPSNPNTLIQQVRSIEMARKPQDTAANQAATRTAEEALMSGTTVQELPPKLAALLGVDDVAAAERAISALRLGQEQLEKQNAELQARLDAIEKDILAKAQAEREAVVDDLIKRGVVSAELREHALTLAASDMNAFTALFAPKKEKAFESLLQKQISAEPKAQKHAPKQDLGKVAMSHREIMDKLVAQGVSLEDATIEAARQLMEV